MRLQLVTLFSLLTLSSVAKADYFFCAQTINMGGNSMQPFCSGIQAMMPGRDDQASDYCEKYTARLFRS